MCKKGFGGQKSWQLSVGIKPSPPSSKTSWVKLKLVTNAFVRVAFLLRNVFKVTLVCCYKR